MLVKHNDISLIVIEEKDISTELDTAIREMLVVCFPADLEHFRRLSWWRSIAVCRALGKNDKGYIVSHTALVERIITIGPALTEMRVIGIQSFCVVPECRGTGLSNKMMSVVLAEGGRQGFDAGLLFCREKLVKVYSSMGWKKLDNAVYTNDDRKGKILRQGITMFYPLKIKRFPTGDIDLAGLDW
ncbi:MAG: GNAT family N-acetyltransferase [Sedimentisphaerales bacterium]|nr:GNAT family N-acetyltransferase [Sedimentisphaerales bacterium]